MNLGLGFYLGVIHNIAKVAIPGFAILIPLASLLRISKAIQASLSHEIEVDWTFKDLPGLVHALKELAEVAVYKTEKEILEAIYFLLCYVTTLEKFLSLEKFMLIGNEAMQAAATPDIAGSVVMFPSCNVTPAIDGDEKGKVCEPAPTLFV